MQIQTRTVALCLRGKKIEYKIYKQIEQPNYIFIYKPQTVMPYECHSSNLWNEINKLTVSGQKTICIDNTNRQYIDVGTAQSSCISEHKLYMKIQLKAPRLHY